MGKKNKNKPGITPVEVVKAVLPESVQKMVEDADRETLLGLEEVSGVFSAATGDSEAKPFEMPDNPVKMPIYNPRDVDPRTGGSTLEYDILSEKTPEDLIASVNKAIQEDWNPIGGVSSTMEYRYIQAMTRIVHV